jgi:hypothetical protein
VRCRQRRSVPFSCIKGDPAPSAGRHLEWHAQRRRKVSRRANIRGRRPNPCERGELILIEHNSTKATSCQVSFTFWSRGHFQLVRTFLARIKGDAGSSPARQSKTDFALAKSNSCDEKNAVRHF